LTLLTPDGEKASAGEVMAHRWDGTTGHWGCRKRIRGNIGIHQGLFKSDV